MKILIHSEHELLSDHENLSKSVGMIFFHNLC